MEAGEVVVVVVVDWKETEAMGLVLQPQDR